MRRVNELIKRELSNLFERLICPNFDCLITVTNVDTTPDLRKAKVHVSVYGNKERHGSVMRVILNERKEMQKQISRNIKLKYTPKLEFQLDDTPESADRVLRLLDQLEKETPPDHEDN